MLSPWQPQLGSSPPEYGRNDIQPGPTAYFSGGRRVVRLLALVRNARQVQIGVVGHHLVRTAPGVPIQPGWNGLGGEIALVRAGIVVADDRLDLADPAVADQLHGLAGGGVRPLLLAGLKDPLVLANRLDHLPPFADRVAQGLLAVHVLAGLAGMDAGQIMPVLGRGVNHHVDVFAVQQLAIVLVGLGAVVARPLLGADHVEIGHGHNSGVGRRRALTAFANDQLPVAPAATDDPDADLFVGAGSRLFCL